MSLLILDKKIIVILSGDSGGRAGCGFPTFRNNGDHFERYNKVQSVSF